MIIVQLDSEQLSNLIQNAVRKVFTEIPSNKVDTTEQPEKWFDLNELIKYDPEKRTKPTWYSKISRNEVPYYKRGKKVYFLKSEIDEWLREGKCELNTEIEQEVEAYLSNKRKGLK